MKRLEFCKEMIEYGPTFWDSDIWSDETTVRPRPQGKEMLFRVHSSHIKEMEDINPQVHSGGFSVMFWGCFSKQGLGPLVALEHNMNAQSYIDLLRDTVIPEIAAVGRPMIFMQDNTPATRQKL